MSSKPDEVADLIEGARKIRRLAEQARAEAARVRQFAADATTRAGATRAKVSRQSEAMNSTCAACDKPIPDTDDRKTIQSVTRYHSQCWESRAGEEVDRPLRRD